MIFFLIDTTNISGKSKNSWQNWFLGRNNGNKSTQIDELSRNIKHNL
jgi:hypothetical protein